MKKCQKSQQTYVHLIIISMTSTCCFLLNKHVFVLFFFWLLTNLFYNLLQINADKSPKALLKILINIHIPRSDVEYY